jgi:hypothetical protein
LDTATRRPRVMISRATEERSDSFVTWNFYRGLETGRCYHEGCDEGLMQVVQEVGHLLLEVGGARGSLLNEVVQQVLDAEGGTLLLQGIGPWG